MLNVEAEGPLSQAGQVGNVEPFGRTAANCHLGVADVIEDEMPVGRVEADPYAAAFVAAPNGVAVAADLDLTGFSHLAFPGEAGQVGIHTIEVKEGEFVLRLEGPPWLQQFRMSRKGRLLLASFSTGGEFIVQLVYSLIQHLLQLPHSGLFLAPNGIVV